MKFGTGTDHTDLRQVTCSVGNVWGVGDDLITQISEERQMPVHELIPVWTTWYTFTQTLKRIHVITYRYLHHLGCWENMTHSQMHKWLRE